MNRANESSFPTFWRGWKRRKVSWPGKGRCQDRRKARCYYAPRTFWIRTATYFRLPRSLASIYRLFRLYLTNTLTVNKFTLNFNSRKAVSHAMKNKVKKVWRLSDFYEVKIKVSIPVVKRSLLYHRQVKNIEHMVLIIIIWRNNR